VIEYLPSYALDCECVLVDADKPVEQKEKSYEERQRAWLEETGLKVGDTVRVVRTAEDGEDGWNNDWVPEMNKYVGNEYTLNRIKGNSGLYIGAWDFPYFVLEKVVSKYKPFTYEDRAEFMGHRVEHKTEPYSIYLFSCSLHDVNGHTYQWLMDNFVWAGGEDKGKPVGKLV
jgi:hypothetical protein